MCPDKTLDTPCDQLHVPGDKSDQEVRKSLELVPSLAGNVVGGTLFLWFNDRRTECCTCPESVGELSSNL